MIYYAERTCKDSTISAILRKILTFAPMEQNLLQTNITYLKGVGPKKAEILKKELGVVTYQDMLNQFPFRYIDRSQSKATMPKKQ